jgi:hypothetical protein
MSTMSKVVSKQTHELSMAGLAIAPATGAIAAAAELLLYEVQPLLHCVHACLQLQHLRSQSLRRDWFGQHILYR